MAYCTIAYSLSSDYILPFCCLLLPDFVCFSNSYPLYMNLISTQYRDLSGQCCNMSLILSEELITKEKRYHPYSKMEIELRE